MLRECVAADQFLTVILRSEGLMLRLSLPVLIRHLATLVDNAPPGELAFAAPPADWIVVVTPEWEKCPTADIATGRIPAKAGNDPPRLR